MNQQEINALVNNLYQAVDNKDVDYLDRHLANKVRFRIGNHPALTNKSEILSANQSFFSSITSMKHSIDRIVHQHEPTSDTTHISCHGTVDYVRLDESEHSAVFSTSLSVQNGEIVDYLVFADLSGL